MVSVIFHHMLILNSLIFFKLLLFLFQLLISSVFYFLSIQLLIILVYQSLFILLIIAAFQSLFLVFTPILLLLVIKRESGVKLEVTSAMINLSHFDTALMMDELMQMSIRVVMLHSRLYQAHPHLEHLFVVPLVDRQGGVVAQNVMDQVTLLLFPSSLFPFPRSGSLRVFHSVDQSLLSVLPVVPMSDSLNVVIEEGVEFLSMGLFQHLQFLGARRVEAISRPIRLLPTLHRFQEFFHIVLLEHFILQFVMHHLLDIIGLLKPLQEFPQGSGNLGLGMDFRSGEDDRLVVDMVGVL